jgi:hypothetical protein
MASSVPNDSIAVLRMVFKRHRLQCNNLNPVIKRELSSKRVRLSNRDVGAYGLKQAPEQPLLIHQFDLYPHTYEILSYKLLLSLQPALTHVIHPVHPDVMFY